MVILTWNTSRSLESERFAVHAQINEMKVSFFFISFLFFIFFPFLSFFFSLFFSPIVCGKGGKRFNYKDNDRSLENFLFKVDRIKETNKATKDNRSEIKMSKGFLTAKYFLSLYSVIHVILCRMKQLFENILYDKSSRSVCTSLILS